MLNKKIGGRKTSMKTIKENTVKAEGQTDGYSRLNRIGTEGKKFLIFGNSITRHPPSRDIGWFTDCGMAASCPETDYVHVLYRETEKKRNVQFLIFQASDFERSFSLREISSEIGQAAEFAPDFVIGRLGENVQPGSFRKGEWKTAYGELLESCSGKNTSVILTTCFWENPAVDEEIRGLASEKKWKIAELGDLGENDGMKAKGLFRHSGVAAHPGDAGMKEIAYRIFNAIKEYGI